MSSGAAAERQPRIEDEASSVSDATTPIVTTARGPIQPPPQHGAPFIPRRDDRSSRRIRSEYSPAGYRYRDYRRRSRSHEYDPRGHGHRDYDRRSRSRDYRPAEYAYGEYSRRSTSREYDRRGYRYRDYSRGSRSREYDLRGRSPSPTPSEWSTYDIDLDGDQSRGPDEPLPREWIQPSTILEDGTATELIVAQSIEHRLSKSGLERIVLLSPSRPPPSSGSTGQEREKSRVQFRWL